MKHFRIRTKHKSYSTNKLFRGRFAAQDEYMVTTVASGEPGSPRPTNTGDHEPGASEGQGSRSRASKLDMLAMTGHSESQSRCHEKHETDTSL